MTIFDIGAFTGGITKTYREMFPHATIYSFEPLPDSFEKLKQLSNDRSIKACKMALSDCVGTAKLHVNFDPSCNSFFPRPNGDIKYYPKKAENTGTIEVKTTTLDHFCDNENISKIDILKLDVEGAEIKVLSGAVGKLSKRAIALIYTEVMFVPHYEGGCMFYELSSFLAKYNYELFDIYHLKRWKNRQLRWGNAIFLSPQIRAKIESTSGLLPED